MEAGDIVNIGEGAVVAGRSLGSGRMTGKPYLIWQGKGCRPLAQSSPFLGSIQRGWIACFDQPGQNGRWLLAQNLVSIRGRAGTADLAEHSCKVLLRLESARYRDIKNRHFRFAQHLLGTLYPLA